MYQSIEKFSLRKINYVKTRTTILKTTTNLLKEKEFEDITIDELCQKAQISRGTFFNYFASKEHIFHYFLRIFTIKVALRMKNWNKDMTFQEKVKQIYKWFEEERQYSKLIPDYIEFIMNIGEDNNNMKLIDAEFVYFFNDVEPEEYDYYNKLTLNELFKKICKQAKEEHQILLQLDDDILSSIIIGEIAGVFLSNTITGRDSTNSETLDIFNKIWNSEEKR